MMTISQILKFRKYVIVCMENKIQSFIAQNHLLEPQSKVLVGLSGGADSTDRIACDRFSDNKLCKGAQNQY